MEAHDKRAQRVSVSQLTVGLSSHSGTLRRAEALSVEDTDACFQKARARKGTAASAVRWWAVHGDLMICTHSQAHHSQDRWWVCFFLALLRGPVLKLLGLFFWNLLQRFNEFNSSGRRRLLKKSEDSGVSLSRPFCRPVLYSYEPQSNF